MSTPSRRHAECLTVLAISFQIFSGVGSQGCRVDSFPVQDHFDTDKYLGKWYEMKWYSEVYFDDSELFQDYTHEYIRKKGGNLTVLHTGRDPIYLVDCFKRQSTLYLTETPGKFMIDEKNQGNLSDFWVIMTDYSNYSVAYGCTTQQQDGTCLKARAWVFSRKTTLADDLSQEADDQLEKLCLNLTSFLVTRQTNDCTDDIKRSTARRAQLTIHLMCFTILGFLLQLTLLLP
nr:purpurin-like [Crassostrea gigas]